MLFELLEPFFSAIFFLSHPSPDTYSYVYQFHKAGFFSSEKYLFLRTRPNVGSLGSTFRPKMISCPQFRFRNVFSVGWGFGVP